MQGSYWRTVSLLAVAGGLMVPCFAGKLPAEEKDGAAAAETKKDDKADAKADGKAAVKGEGRVKGGKGKEAGGRLPAYYADLVDGEQRAKIYAIQAEHDPGIKQLQVSLKEAMAKRDAAVAAVLTPAQQEKLAKLEAEAKEKRVAKQTKPGVDEKNATASAESGKKAVKKEGDTDEPKVEKTK
jgi:hypothetical protein